MTAEPDNADKFLVERIREGDQLAWRQLIERYHGRLLAFALARTGRSSDADDVVQEALVGFLQSLPFYDPNRSLETYLFTILRYKLIDLMRQRRTDVIPEPAESEDWWDRVTPTGGETPSGVLAQAEAALARERILAEVLRRLIHELRDRHAFADLQVIELVFFGGWRNLQVAELLEMDQKAVAGVKFRAIQRLRKFLLEQDDDLLAAADDDRAEVTVARVWREHRLTCLKRSTLGAFLSEVLEEPWRGYTQFHLDVVACPMCLANVRDLQSEEDRDVSDSPERIFQSSAGFLSRVPPPADPGRSP